VTREIRTPGPDHPITVERNPARVTVRVGDQVIADTTAAQVLRESNYPPVQYIPLADVAPVLKPTQTSTYCPYKGDASYFTLVTDSGEATDAVWTYRSPYPAVAAIADHVAFYPNQVTITEG
jgi:uncharacterized protein (DUF427 family)